MDAEINIEKQGEKDYIVNVKSSEGDFSILYTRDKNTKLVNYSACNNCGYRELCHYLPHPLFMNADKYTNQQLRFCDFCAELLDFNNLSMGELGIKFCYPKFGSISLISQKFRRIIEVLGAMECIFPSLREESLLIPGILEILKIDESFPALDIIEILKTDSNLRINF